MAKGTNQAENSPLPRTPAGTPTSFVPYYNPIPTDSYAKTYPPDPQPMGKSPARDSSSSELHYAPCSFVPSRTYGFQRLKNFSFTRGLYECQNICRILYGGLKFAVCLPVLDCRCLTKGLFQLRNWWSDVREDPMTKPLAIAYQLSKASATY